MIVISLLSVTACSGENTGSKSVELSQMERGAILYKRCQTCHTLNEGGRHRVGPNLWGVINSDAGSKSDFRYSRAMQTSGVIWTDEALDAYLANPREFIPQNRMSFAGLRRDEDRAAVIAYLREKTGAVETAPDN